MDAEKLKEAEAVFKKQQEMFELFSKTILNSLENIQGRFTKNIQKDTEAKKDRYDRLTSALTMSWGKVFRQLETGIETGFARMTRDVGQGGFGQWGVETGRKLGGAMGESLAKKLGAKSPEMGRMIGQFAGGALVAALQSGEAIRMMGAKFSPVMTAGLRGRSDYGTMGGELIRQSNRIRLETGAAQEEVLALASQLSKLGIPFDQTGEKATRYALAAERVLNLDRGMVSSMDESVITKYGQSWEDVATILGGVSSATEYWHYVAKQTNSSLAASLASNNSLAKMYMEVQQAMSGTSLEAKGVAESLIGTVNVMGSMGLRPGMMTAVNKEFMAKLAPKTSGFMSMLGQGFFLADTLQRSEMGRQILGASRGVAKQMNMDPQMLTLPLNQLLASNDKMSRQYIQAMVEGIGNMRDDTPGRTKSEKNTQALFRLEGTFGISPMTGNVLLTMADRYKENIGRGMKPEEAWQNIGKDESFKAATAQAGMGGMDPDEVLKIASGMGAASLSTQDKLTMVAENLGSFAGTYFDKLKADGKGLFEEAARFLSPREAGAAIPPAGAQPDPSLTPSPSAQRESFQDQPTGGPMANPPRPRTLFSYPMSTSKGTEQVTTTVDETKLQEMYGQEAAGIAKGISSVESGGHKNPYAALGPTINKPGSQWYGDRAYGKYQVMGGNVPEWTNEALGKSLSPQEFLADPMAQEMTARYRFQKQLSGGSTPEDVASRWLTGRSYQDAVRRGSKDVMTGISAADYTRRAINNMGTRG